MITETVKQVLREGTTDKRIDKAWEDAENLMGASNMLSVLYSFLDGDTIAEFIDELDRVYELHILTKDEDEEFGF